MASNYRPVPESWFDYACQQQTWVQDPILKELREETFKIGESSRMMISEPQAAFLTLLTSSLGVKRALEVGTFTGSSSYSIARGLPADGKLICCDISPEWTSVARKYWKKAGVDSQITLHIGPAAETMHHIPMDPPFDLAFIDADKLGYDEYYELILPRMRSNGVILFDNMYLGGKAMESGPKDETAKAIADLNQKLTLDPRIDSMLLPFADGIRFCRKK